MKIRLIAVLLIALFLLPAAAGAQTGSIPPERMLASYVNAPDPAYKWEKGPVTPLASATAYDLVLTTQTWHGITWQHLVRIIKPAQVRHPGWMLLFITGGSGAPTPGQQRGEDAIDLAFAQAMQAPVATLFTVPNQPLFGDLVEDGIISLTFANYLQDGDPTWPLLFPMVKSAVRAMDAVQDYTRQEWGAPVHSFVVTGASKRGWTTWLTACTGDKRVKAIAPMVIDTLNFSAQFPYALTLWGHYSEKVTDYTDKGLTEVFDRAPGRQVWAAVDPYTFRSGLTLPKLMVLGANDPYWPTGALNLYWDGLLAPKYVLYAPNSGHDLDDRQRVFATMGAFFRTVAAGKPLPRISWSRQVKGDQLTLTLTAPAATGARAWIVKSNSLDFRPQKWQAVPMAGSKGKFRITLPRSASKNLAVFGEADFTADGQPYTLSTQTAILASAPLLRLVNNR